MRRTLMWIPILVGCFLGFYVAAGAFRGPNGSPTAHPFPTPMFGLLLLVVFTLFFVFFFRRNLKQLEKFEVRPLSEGDISRALRKQAEALEALGFKALSGPVVLVGRVGLQVQPLVSTDRRTYGAVFTLWQKQRVSFDFDSRLSDGRIVNTSASAWAARAPVRSDFLIQVFPKLTPSELLQRHEEALTALAVPVDVLGQQLDDYLAICRETYRRQLTGLGVGGALRLMLPSKSPHLEPIATRPR
jgi:hypothetical protein